MSHTSYEWQNFLTNALPCCYIEVSVWCHFISKCYTIFRSPLSKNISFLKQEYLFGCFNFKASFYSFPWEVLHTLCLILLLQFWTEKEKWTCENRDCRYISVDFFLGGSHADHRYQKSEHSSHISTTQNGVFVPSLCLWSFKLVNLAKVHTNSFTLMNTEFHSEK